MHSYRHFPGGHFTSNRPIQNNNGNNNGDAGLPEPAMDAALAYAVNALNPRYPKQSTETMRAAIQAAQPYHPQRVPQQGRPTNAWMPSRTVTFTSIISYRMYELVPQHTVAYIAAYMNLHELFQFIVTQTIAFRFITRPALPNDDPFLSKEASFFINKLKAASPELASHPPSIVGLRCACCFKSKDYLVGSTNFLDLRDQGVDEFAKAAIKGRHRHLMSCPYVKDKDKGRLFAFRPKKRDYDLLDFFLEQWMKVLKATKYQHLYQKPKPNPLQQKLMKELEDMEVTEASIERDLLSSMHKAQQINGAKIVVDDLAGPLVLDGRESSAFEAFMQNYRLLMKRLDHQWQLELRCQHCNYLSHCISKLLTENHNEETSHDMWNFVTKHCLECNDTPQSVKHLFKKQRSMDPPLQSIALFLKEWKDILHGLLRWTTVNLEPKPDLELFVPFSLKMMREYKPLPCQKDPESANTGTILQVNVNKNDVIVGSELHRDMEGNRWFRQLVSENRALYSRLPPNQQSAVVDTIISLVSRLGGSFYRLDTLGGCLRLEPNKCVRFTTNALEHGFPEMLRPPMSGSRGASKVSNVEYPPMIGILHGNIWWENVPSTAPLLHVSNLEKRKGRSEAEARPKEGEGQARLSGHENVFGSASVGVVNAKETKNPSVHTCSTTIIGSGGTRVDSTVGEAQSASRPPHPDAVKKKSQEMSSAVTEQVSRPDPNRTLPSKDHSTRDIVDLTTADEVNPVQKNGSNAAAEKQAPKRKLQHISQFDFLLAGRKPESAVEAKSLSDATREAGQVRKQARLQEVRTTLTKQVAVGDTIDLTFSLD